MEQYSRSIIAILFFLLIVFWHSQTKFKNKMLCYFLRPNKQRIKKWVPLYTKHVIFDRGKYGIERYAIIPKCIVLEWYNGGVNRLFPTLIPTLEFVWSNRNPRDPETGEPSIHSPEVEAAAYQGQSYVGLARAMNQQAGVKRNKLMEMIPLICLGLLIIIGFLVYSGMANIQNQLAVQQQIQQLKK